MYIGLSEDIEKRWYDHMHSPSIKYSRIDRAIRKHGVDKFDLEIIEELPNDRALLMKREEYWVAHYNTYEDDFHYNLTPGGDFAPSKLPEVQAKMSKALSGENHPMYGCKHTPEAKAKISKSVSGKNHPMYGKKHTPETKAKMSKAKSGKKLSQKTRKKISKAQSGKNNNMYGKKHTQEIREKMSKARNTSGYYHVHKRNNKTCKQGFLWTYTYYEDKKQKAITSVDIKKLEEKVRAKGLKWLKFDE